MSQGFNLREYIVDQYAVSAQVMPDTWIGHAKLYLNEQDLHPRTKARVLRHTKNIVQEKDLPSKAVTKKVIEKID